MVVVNLYGFNLTGRMLSLGAPTLVGALKSEAQPSLLPPMGGLALTSQGYYLLWIFPSEWGSPFRVFLTCYPCETLLVTSTSQFT